MSQNEFPKFHDMIDTVYPFRQWITGHNLAHLKKFDSREWGYGYDSDPILPNSDEEIDNLLDQFEEIGLPQEGWEFEFHCEPNPDYRA